MFQLDLLKGKRILVTGGGTGLGRSMSHRFLELGANVVICGRREDVLEQTAEELTKETGAEIETVRCDVRLPDAVEAMMDRIWQKRPLDILVNNAAGQILAPTHKMSSRAIDAVLGIVLHGSAYCTVAAGRRWIDAGERNKVVMSILTVSALMGAPFTVPSAMAKAGVLAMTKSLAVEWGPRGIRTCAIVPGLFPTEGAWSRLMPKERGGDEELVKTIPLRRVGEHIELANLAAFLVSDGAAYINGDAVVIDGGKMQSGGGGASTQSMLDWTDEQWEAIRPKKK
ncbi:MAG TPA: SDR family oxidoreductase [Xanthobacteraceae bacterium]|jgi:NAD(P)-dependent dehydrogenase (short-subunit alcohol dehydrogenase family)|nr:SDR family oxidoreductase [Propionibacteriaceae bacterium]